MLNAEWNCKRISAVGVMMSLLMLAFSSNVVFAEEQSCFAHINYGQSFDVKPRRSLYVLVDQTVPISTSMRQRITTLLKDWGQVGDKVHVIKFSANMRDSYPEVVFQGVFEPKPSADYLFNLRYSDKEKLLACLDKKSGNNRMEFESSISQVLSSMDPGIPKTDILFSFKQITRELLAKDTTMVKKVFIITDGMENSSVLSFYRQGGLRSFKPNKMMSKVRRAGLVSNWHRASVYIYGLGLDPKEKRYSSHKRIDALQRFWEHYFVEGNAVVKAMGTPEFLLSSLD